MLGIKIQDSAAGHLGFDLRDILLVIGDSVRASQWRCSDLWYLEERDGQVGELRERRRRFSGEEIIEFAAGVRQTIDGRFVAKSTEGKRPWLIILAVDSSWWEVWSSKPKVLENLKSAFTKVSALESTDSSGPSW